MLHRPKRKMSTTEHSKRNKTNNMINYIKGLVGIIERNENPNLKQTKAKRLKVVPF